MITFEEEISKEVQIFTDKEKKNYKIDVAIRLSKKLVAEKKTDWESDFEDLIKLLQNDEQDKQKLKNFRKAYNALAEKVRKKYSYVEKGSLQGNAMAIGIAVGIAIGAGMLSISPAFMGVGIAIGVAIGLAIGAGQEQEADKKGRLF